MNSIAKLNGLVLAGGQSRRMGTDKGLLDYHNQPQRFFIYDLLNEFCEQVYMSIREDQQEEFNSETLCIVDHNNHLGPFNGLMSAHVEHPDKAWLVLACDMPLIDRESISRLIEKRAILKNATAYQASHQTFPEPLFAIWEPEGLSAAQDYLKNGDSCSPVKFLSQSTVEIVNPLSDQVLLNINDTEDYQSILNKIKEKSES
ncbi:NTP transferase domain-containing protein [Galbibacter sp.]|uniref:NTP transferase domain-containing protein n=1 Tax=Galbibacter sp. TaxID=2918471 RepID=UPI003A946B20